MQKQEIDLWEYIKLPLFFNKLKELFTKELDNKVDKIQGKKLSENDYTNTDKDKVTKLNFSKLVSACEIYGYTIVFKDIDDNIIKTFDIPQPAFSIVDGELFVSY